MKEIEEAIRKQIESNPEYEKTLQHHANKFFFWSSGGWISEDGLLDKLVPGWVKGKYKEEQVKSTKQNLQTVLLALLVTNKAIRKTESDGVTRYKFTEKGDIHLEFLEAEKNNLLERLKWIEERIRYFTFKKEAEETKQVIKELKE